MSSPYKLLYYAWVTCGASRSYSFKARNLKSYFEPPKNSPFPIASTKKTPKKLLIAIQGGFVTEWNLLVLVDPSLLHHTFLLGPSRYREYMTYLLVPTTNHSSDIREIIREGIKHRRGRPVRELTSGGKLQCEQILKVTFRSHGRQ